MNREANDKETIIHLMRMPLDNAWNPEQELLKVQEKSWARRPSHRNHGQDARATSNFEQFLESGARQ